MSGEGGESEAVDNVAKSLANMNVTNENINNENLNNQINETNNSPAEATGAIARVRPDKSTGAIPKEKPVSTSKQPKNPLKKKGMRACLVCSMVKTIDEWLTEGCDNCEDFLKMRNNPENMHMCTTPMFDGVFHLRNPDAVVRWPRNIKRRRGFYAQCVYVKLPNGSIREMRAHIPSETDKASVEVFLRM